MQKRVGNKTGLVILMIIFMVLWPVFSQIGAPYRPISGIPAQLEVMRQAIGNLQAQHQQDVNDHLHNVMNLPAGHISILLDSGEREDKALWLEKANEAKAELEALMAAILAAAPG